MHASDKMAVSLYSTRSHISIYTWKYIVIPRGLPLEYGSKYRMRATGRICYVKPADTQNRKTDESRNKDDI